MKILGIIQARLGSTRLPRKIFADIGGKRLIRHVVERSAASRHIGAIIVATTVEPEDAEVAEYATGVLGCGAFRGSTDDVLSRFYECAAPHAPDIIVRITADDPLKDAAIIDRAVEHLLADPALAYCSNTISPTFPEGFDIEAFRFSALERAHREAKLPSEREHVTPYIWKSPDKFAALNFTHDENLSDWRLTVDKPADLELMRAIFGELGKQTNLFSYREVIALLKARPELLDINRGTIRNEGYAKSLQQEGQG
jgi:spore coat polysaccharide biosynthesis protein SpsF